MDMKSQACNQLLASLTSDAFARIQPDLVAMDLPLRKQLETAGAQIQHVYFPSSGLASVVARSRSLQQIEVGLIGREGMTGLSLALGEGCARHSAYMQLAGEGWRLGAQEFTQAIQESRSFRDTILHYAQTMMVQLSSTALANGRQSIERRLARWLLMAHDRVDGDCLALTHEFLGVMLGVRRPGVTAALKHLHDQGMLDNQRGRLIITSRAGLEELADGSYGMAEAEYRRLFVPSAPVGA